MPNIVVSHLVRGSWICPRMRRAIAIVAISPRRISYITVTLLLFECKKRMYTRQSFTLPRPAEVDRSELGSTRFRCRVGSCETRRVCSLRYRSTGTISRALSTRVILQRKKNFVSGVCPHTPASSNVVRSLLSRFRSL